MDPVSSRPRADCDVAASPPRDMIFTVDGVVPKEYCCLKCDKVLEDPILTGCCGKNMCTACIGVAEKDGVCPSCEADGLSYIKDQRVVREIKSVIIFCKYRDKGCIWLGSVHKTKEHLETECKYVEVVCSTCKGVVQRCDLLEHLQAKCNIEWYQCSFCKQLLPKDSMEAHVKEQCQEYMFPCPHGCGAEIKRSIKAEHEDSCPKMVIQCPFKEAGCEEGIVRENEPQHMKDKHLDHSTLAFLSMQKKIKEISDELIQTKDEMKEMKEKMDTANLVITNLSVEAAKLKDRHREMADLLQSELAFFVNQSHNSTLKNLSIECMRVQLALLSDPTSLVLSPGHSLLFRLPMYSFYKTQTSPWYSPPFIVQNGYQMCIAVHLNGDQEGFGTHISIHVHLMAGGMDGKLTWPLIFHDLIVVSLMNQLFDGGTSSVKGSSPLLNRLRSKSEDGRCSQQQTIRTVAHTLSRVNKPTGEIGLSFGYIALFFALSNINSSVLVNDSLVFKLEIRNQNTIKRQ